MYATVTEKTKQTLDMSGLCRPSAEASLLPMAAVEGANHIVRYVNPAFCLLVGKPKDELIGQVFGSAASAGAECLTLLDRVYRTGQAEIHTGREHSAAHPFYWSYTVWPMFAADERIVGVIFEVTEATPFHHQVIAMNQALIIGSVRQHELTEAAEKLNVQLQTEIKERRQVEEELRRANEDLSHFAYAASHDLQEPLRMITIYAQLLVQGYRGDLTDEASVCVEVITKGTRQMRELLADLLSYTEVGAEEREAAECIDLNLVVQKAIENLEAAIAESATVITCSGALPTVQGYEAHFVQLFQNLIGNAIKYGGERAPRIHVSAEELNGAWRIAVTDNGMGIQPEYHQTIFGVFKRLHGKAIPGTGIGLAICQRVVERYGGRIWVESQLQQGATFYFTLPAGKGKPR